MGDCAEEPQRTVNRDSFRKPPPLGTLRTHPELFRARVHFRPALVTDSHGLLLGSVQLTNQE